MKWDPLEKVNLSMELDLCFGSSMDVEIGILTMNIYYQKVSTSEESSLSGYGVSRDLSTWHFQTKSRASLGLALHMSF